MVGSRQLQCALLTSLLLAGCATDKIILLPNQDGTASSLIVRTSKGEQVLDQPYTSVNVAEGGALRQEIQNADGVAVRYARTLESQPPRETLYVLYFPLDSVEITAESRAVLQQVKEDLKSRPVPEIMVVGHADAVGDDAYNDALSLERAKTMSRLLIAEGIAAEKLSVAGRGKRELLVKTAPGKREPRNRRVEIIVK